MTLDVGINHISERLRCLPLFKEYKFENVKRGNREKISGSPSNYSLNCISTKENSSADILFFGEQFHYWNTSDEQGIGNKLQASIITTPKDLSNVDEPKIVADKSANPINFMTANRNILDNKILRINLCETTFEGTVEKPIFSALSPVETKVSPNKRKRSSDSFSSQHSTDTESCDLEVSNISFNDNFNIKRTLSFDEELLNINKSGSIWTDKSLCSGFSAKTPHKRNRPSINIERQGCRSQPSYFREFSSISNTRKVQIIHKGLMEDNDNKLNDSVLNANDQGVNSNTNIRSGRVFKPIQFNEP